MIHLPNVTVIIADTKNYGPAAYAIQKTLEQIKPAKTVWLTDIDYNHPDVDIVRIPAINSKSEYSKILIKDLNLYFHTSYCLVIQHDGYVINGESWSDEYLKYDYVAAPWLYPDPDRNVGNGGFSLRSKTLQVALRYDENIEIVEPEDEVIGRLYRRYLEQKHDIKFAPEELADTFSYELRTPICKTFGFHGYFHEPYKPMVVIRRPAAMGDCIQVEPVLEYFHKKGYRVVLDTLPQFESLFYSHYFPVSFPHQVDPRVLATAKVYNLEMSYESNPKQLHLKSYYDFCEVPENEQVIRNPRLNVVVDRSNTLFPNKYACLHIDKRSQEGRNIHGIDWGYIVEYLERKGYTVFQIGKGESEETNAIKMNTLAEPLLMYMLAGADCVIGIDSGPMNVAVALGRKCIVFHGNVNPDYIWPDQKNIRIITNHKPNHNLCSLRYCWHESVTTVGQDCIDNKLNPPCVQFQTGDLVNAINELI